MFVDDDIEASPGWLRALLERRRRASGRGGVHGADPGAPGGPPAAQLRTRGAADHGARPRRRRHRGELRLGRQHGDPPSRARARRARSTPRWSTAATSRSGRNACAQADPRARVLYVAGAAVEHRRAGSDARLRSLSRAAFVRGARRAALRRAPGPRTLAAPGAAHARGLPGARPSPPLPRRPDDGRAQRGAPAAGAARTPPGATVRAAHARRRRGLPVGHERNGRRPRRPAPRRGRRGGRRLGARSAADACGSSSPRGGHRRGAGCSSSASCGRSGASWPRRSAPSWPAPATRSSCTPALPDGRGKFENLNLLLGDHPPLTATGCW